MEDKNNRYNQDKKSICENFWYMCSKCQTLFNTSEILYVNNKVIHLVICDKCQQLK